MTCKPQFLNPLSQATQGFSIFCYETQDEIEDISRPGYFAPAINSLKELDIVFVYAAMNRRPAMGLFVVCNIDNERDLIELADFHDFKLRKAGSLGFLEYVEKHANQENEKIGVKKQKQRRKAK